MSNPVAAEAHVGVALVFSPGQVMFHTIGRDIPAACCQQGAYPLQAVSLGDRANSDQSTEGGAAKQAHEQCFCQVVFMMACGDGLAVGLSSHCFKGRQTQVPPGGLYREPVGFGIAHDIHTLGQDEQAISGREVFDEVLVGVGLGPAKLMVDMAADEPQGGGGRKLLLGQQQVQQGHGVGPAGDGDEDAPG